jgi:Flp pilus assembly protein TadD
MTFNPSCLALLAALALAGCSGDGGITTQSIDQSDPRVIGEPVTEGRAHLQRKDYGLAEKSFKAAIEANPKSINGWAGLAASFDGLRRFDMAEMAFDQVVKLSGHTPEVLNNLGYHYLLKGDRQQARRYLQAAAEKDPNNTLILSNLKLLESSKSDHGRM